MEAKKQFDPIILEKKERLRKLLEENKTRGLQKRLADYTGVGDRAVANWKGGPELGWTSKKTEDKIWEFFKIQKEQRDGAERRLQTQTTAARQGSKPKKETPSPSILSQKKPDQKQEVEHQPSSLHGTERVDGEYTLFEIILYLTQHVESLREQQVRIRDESDLSMGKLDKMQNTLLALRRLNLLPEKLSKEIFFQSSQDWISGSNDDDEEEGSNNDVNNPTQ